MKAFPSTLRDKTLHLLQNRNVKLTLKQISKDTGLGETWLSMFNQEKISNPSVGNVQTLYEYLTKSVIKV